MMEREVAARPTMEQVLSHEWLEEGDQRNQCPECLKFTDCSP